MDILINFELLNTTMTTRFYFLKKISLSKRTVLKKFLQKIADVEKTKIKELSIIFCSDSYLLEINKTFLSHNYHTDIITFDLTEKNEIAKTAELYISVDRVRANSIEYQSSINNELHRVVFHGILHLCGYKDKSRIDIQKMREKENKYLNLYFKK